MPQSYKTDVKELRFTAPTLEANGWTSAGTGVNLRTDGRVELTDLNDYIATGDRGYLIDNLLQVDFVAYVSGWGAGDEGYIGMIGTPAGSVPASISVACWFKLVGSASAGPRVYLESKDGTTTVADEDTGINLRQGKWNRFTLDFAMGIQTISPPGKSKGGKGAIQYAVTNDRGWSQSPLLTKFLDMYAYSGILQPFVLKDLGTNPIWVEGCDISYRRYGSQE